MYTLINTIEDLKILNQELLTKDCVGVDTEFRRTTKFNMKLALLQVNDGDEIYLVDTVLIDDPKDNCSFLYSEKVVKIFHSCKEDIEAVYSWTKRKMINIFDTQLADSFLGNEFSISYQNLVKKSFGITLSKKETRSNWLRRPLSDDQLKYASLDVEYLIHLYEEMSIKLTATKKINWLNEDIQKLLETNFSTDSYIKTLERVVTRKEEADLLFRLNNVIERIARKEMINSTLFFSKKSQKDFLNLVLSNGIEKAFLGVTQWRRELIERDLIELLR